MNFQFKKSEPINFTGCYPFMKAIYCQNKWRCRYSVHFYIGSFSLVFFSIPSLLYHVLVGIYVFSIHIITHIIMNGYIVMRYLTKVSFARLIIIGFLPRPFERWVHIYRVTQIKVWIFFQIHFVELNLNHMNYYYDANNYLEG